MYVHSFNIFRLIWYLEKAGVINKHEIYVPVRTSKYS
jgi:hypothetical protein